MKHLLLSLIFIFITHNAYAKGNEMSPLHNEPYFTVKINSFGVSFFLDVNGSSIFREFNDDGQITTSIPVNHFMAPDKNSIEIHVLPPEQGMGFNPNSRIEVMLIVSPNSNKEAETVIASINFNGSKEAGHFADDSSSSGVISSVNGKQDISGDIVIEDISYSNIPDYTGGVSIRRNMNIPSDLPRWAFLDSDELPDLDPLSDDEYYALMDTLLVKYMKVQNAIENKMTDDVIDMFKERNVELDKAFYYPPGTTEAKIKKSLHTAANDNDMELVGLSRDNVDFTVESNNKLVSLTRTGLGAAIALNFKSGYGSQRYNLIFRRDNNEWILTR